MFFKKTASYVRAVKDRDPAARNCLEVLLLYSGVHALIFHQLAHFLYRIHFYFLARLISQISRFLTGIEIHPGAKIGYGVFIDHGMGVVIGETAEVGDDCTIYQGSTLGGTGKDKGKRHPTLKDGVLVGAGAKVLGPFTIGANSKVAAGAVVLNEVGEYQTVVGIPGKVVNRKKHNSCYEELDQVNIPDPVAQELCRLTQKINQLEEKIKILEEEKQNEK